MSIRIVTDSSCDLPPAVIAQYGITVVPLYINIGDKGYRDGLDISRQEFYERLPSLTTPPSTAAPSPDKFCAVYEQLAHEGATEILSIHMSVSLSATVNTAHLCAQEKRSVPVTVLDARQLSLGVGLQVTTAAQAADEGHSMAEILARLEDQIPRTYVFAALDTLEYLKRSGRMSAAVAGLGNLLQIKPLLRMYDGQPTVERVRTANGATRRLIEILTELGPLEQVALLHTHAADKAELLRQQAQHLLPAGEIPCMDITPVIGANIGPGAAGFCCITAHK